MNMDQRVQVLLLELLLRLARGEAVIESSEVWVNINDNQGITLEVRETELGRRRRQDGRST